MKNVYRVAGLAGCFLTLSLSSEAVRAVDLGIDPRFQDRFRITEFATGLDFPNGIAQLGDGSLVVGTTQGRNFFDRDAKGQLIRLQDTNGDGVAETKTILYDGAQPGNNLPGGISAVRVIDNYLFVTTFGEGHDRISIFQQGANFSANSLAFKGSVDFAFPAGRYQATSALAVRQTGTEQFDLFFNLGATVNNQATLPNSISVSGQNGITLPLTNLTGDSIYKLPITIGSNLTVGQPTVIATGLRNAAALEFSKTTGDLYIGENGIDNITNVGLYQSLTADEINRLTVAQLDNSDPKNFGFPAYGTQYGLPGVFVNGEGQIVSTKDPSFLDPLATFQPLDDPKIGSQSTGVASIAFVPTAFPNELKNGLFLGFFGRLVYGPDDDIKNPLIYYDLATNEYSHFLSTNRVGGNFGHFGSLLASDDSLFATDIGARSGLLFSSPGSGLGKVYQLQALQTAQIVPEPSTMLGTALAIGCGAWLKRKVKKVRHRELAICGDG
ncbi:PEP-CTERM sorting domain-containing protein [Chamaesiphon minutus]|uniref:PEP-CTERM putative exosortase interaction domain-containing protein n=1 Tax=Chamaesiphon minutus (strain ATCC 27169 / PCC 6605) TaxID=1173020 RepID=K9UMM7_CHAP6|nr:PEP-CTERM sorting domain-containing protein [Chamaesiphon minutus]AFY96342.1 PEP-CTERM putative exosortase interaction domain-containing protein [Chamaesiphon minutus PCC 6605]